MQVDANKEAVVSDAMNESLLLTAMRKFSNFLNRHSNSSSKEHRKLSTEELRKKVEETYDPEFISKIDKIHSHLPSKEEVIRMLNNGEIPITK